MGKSAAAEILRSRRVPVVDTDQLARQLVEPGQPALEAIRRHFGSTILDSQGLLCRGELARRVFTNPEERAALEGILHPRIRAVWRSKVAAWSDQEVPLAVVVIPLLFETGAQRDLDVTVCVACSQATQAQRLAERGWSSDETRQRICAQWPVEKKMDVADYVVWTEGSLEVHAAQLQRVVEEVLSGA